MVIAWQTLTPWGSSIGLGCPGAGPPGRCLGTGCYLTMLLEVTHWRSMMLQCGAQIKVSWGALKVRLNGQSSSNRARLKNFKDGSKLGSTVCGQKQHDDRRLMAIGDTNTIPGDSTGLWFIRLRTALVHAAVPAVASLPHTALTPKPTVCPSRSEQSLQSKNDAVSRDVRLGPKLNTCSGTTLMQWNLMNNFMPSWAGLWFLPVCPTFPQPSGITSNNCRNGSAKPCLWRRYQTSSITQQTHPSCSTFRMIILPQNFQPFKNSSYGIFLQFCTCVFSVLSH